MDGFSELEEASQAILYGHHRLRFMAKVADLPPTFATADAIKASGLHPSVVSKEIRHLREAGLLRKVRHGTHERLHESFWHGCRALHDELTAGMPKPVNLRSVRRQRKS